MPTLVATREAPTKMASTCGAPQARRIPQPAKNGTMTPTVATNVALPPTFRSSEAFTSIPTPNRRNKTPRSERALRVSLGAIHPKTLGPTNAPAKISHTIAGWPKRSNNSANSLAEPKMINIARGSGRGSCIGVKLAALRRCAREFAPSDERSQAAAHKHGDNRDTPGNEKIGREERGSGEELPLEHHRVTVKRTVTIARIRPKQITGIRRVFVQLGLMVPSRVMRRISES